MPAKQVRYLQPLVNNSSECIDRSHPDSMRNKHSARRRFGKPLLGRRKVGRRACCQNSYNSLGTVTYECFFAPASKLACSQSLRASIRLVAEQSLVQIRPPQLEVFSFQLLRDTLQPSELTIRPAQRRQGRECETQSSAMRMSM